MDGSMDSTETEEEGIQLYEKQLECTLENGSLVQQKLWSRYQVKIAGSVEILEKHLLEIKALDVQCLPLNDQFTFTMSNNKEKVTLPKGCFLVG